MINVPLSHIGPAPRTNTTRRGQTTQTGQRRGPWHTTGKRRAKEVNRGTAPSVGRYAASDAGPSGNPGLTVRIRRNPHTITKEVVETARESLVIGSL